LSTANGLAGRGLGADGIALRSRCNSIGPVLSWCPGHGHRRRPPRPPIGDLSTSSTEAHGALAPPPGAGRQVDRRPRRLPSDPIIDAIEVPACERGGMGHLRWRGAVRAAAGRSRGRARWTTPVSLRRMQREGPRARSDRTHDARRRPGLPPTNERLHIYRGIPDHATVRQRDHLGHGTV